MTITLNLNLTGHMADVFGDQPEDLLNQRAEADRFVATVRPAIQQTIDEQLKQFLVFRVDKYSIDFTID